MKKLLSFLKRFFGIDTKTLFDVCLDSIELTYNFDPEGTSLDEAQNLVLLPCKVQVSVDSFHKIKEALTSGDNVVFGRTDNKYWRDRLCNRSGIHLYSRNCGQTETLSVKIVSQSVSDGIINNTLKL